MTGVIGVGQPSVDVVPGRRIVLREQSFHCGYAKGRRPSGVGGIRLTLGRLGRRRRRRATRVGRWRTGDFRVGRIVVAADADGRTDRRQVRRVVVLRLRFAQRRQGSRFHVGCLRERGDVVAPAAGGQALDLGRILDVVGLALVVAARAASQQRVVTAETAGAQDLELAMRLRFESLTEPAQRRRGQCRRSRLGAALGSTGEAQRRRRHLFRILLDEDAQTNRRFRLEIEDAAVAGTSAAAVA